MNKFSAYVVSESGDGYKGEVVEKTLQSLEDGQIQIQVKYSSLNFKDALSNAGNKGVTRSYPHTPGIDAAGVVTESKSSKFSVGQEVIVTGYDLGMNTAGGFGELIQVPEGWVIPLPVSLSLKDSMAWGTAGLTAALCVEPIVEKMDSGRVLVSGATGGVGSIAIQLLSKLGYEVIALTRKEDAKPFLKSLGASDVLLVSDFLDDSKKPMLKPAFEAAVDVAGGKTLTSILKQVNYQGVVSCCGLVDRPDFESSIFPFILRGVTLAGIDSVELPNERKASVWNKISNEWSLDGLMDHCATIGKSELATSLELILNGNAVGRYILQH